VKKEYSFDLHWIAFSEPWIDHHTGGSDAAIKRLRDKASDYPKQLVQELRSNDEESRSLAIALDLRVASGCGRPTKAAAPG
jgi:hypothetical protein